MRRVSENELRGVLRAAMRGSALPYGDYENSAEQILWALMHDCVSWEQLDEVLDRLQSSSMKLLPPRDQGRIELKGGTLALYGVQLGDFCMSRALQNGGHTCLISDARDAEFLGLKLVEGMTLGLFGCLLWSDGDEVKSLYTEALNKKPQYCVWRKKSEDLSYVVLAFSDSAQHMARLFSHHWSRPTEFARTVVSPDDMTERYHQNIDDGLSVPPESWQRLQQMAASLLVPNTDQSRLGAGA